MEELESDIDFDKIKNFYEVTEVSDSVMPDGKGIMGMYAGGKWYKLTLKKEFELVSKIKRWFHTKNILN